MSEAPARIWSRDKDLTGGMWQDRPEADLGWNAEYLRADLAEAEKAAAVREAVEAERARQRAEFDRVGAFVKSRIEVNADDSDERFPYELALGVLRDLRAAIRNGEAGHG